MGSAGRPGDRGLRGRQGRRVRILVRFVHHEAAYPDQEQGEAVHKRLALLLAVPVADQEAGDTGENRVAGLE